MTATPPASSATLPASSTRAPAATDSAPTPTVAAPAPTDAPANPPTSTRTPAPVINSPTSAPSQPCIVVAQDANVRAGPGPAYPPHGVLRTGEMADVLGQDQTRAWYFIIFPDSPDGRGWIWEELVTPCGDHSSLPTVVAPPTPTLLPIDTPTDTPRPGVETSTLLPIASPTCTPGAGATAVPGGDC